MKKSISSKPNYILQYWAAIESGSILVSKRLRQQYEKIVHQLKVPYKDYVFDVDKATKPIDYIEDMCRQSKSNPPGKPLLLELWQKAMLQAVFGFVHRETGHRQHRFVDVYIGRKNGKSTLAAAIGLYMLTSDGEGGAEVYSMATKKDQAKIIWVEAKRMVRQSPMLRRMIRSLVGELAYDRRFGSFKPLASEENSLDGLNSHCVLVDELHAIKDVDLIHVMEESTSSRAQPIVWKFTTMGTVREAAFDDIYARDCDILDGNIEVDHTLSFIYALDDEDDWKDERNWIKANPNLGVSKTLQYIRDKVQIAMRSESERKSLMCKDFNRRETSSQSWLSFQVIQNLTLFVPEKMGFNYGIGGADLSETTDLTAAKMICMKPNDPHIYVMQMYWMPEELIEQRAKEDGVPYDKWHRQGLLRSCPGNKIDRRDVTQWYLELKNEYDIYLYKCGFDAWSAEYWVTEMECWFGKRCMEPIRQGKRTLSMPMKRLERDFESKLIIYNDNPIDKWCLTNTSVDIDIKNHTIQPSKPRNRKQRIDGTAALLNAYTSLLNNENDYMKMIGAE